ncbi:MAG: type I restriction enzyme HsdR N-terminal domain-containing protein [Sphingobacteriales bacterium]|nr:MAG: type I restriction enzyme HsdR N-terminal domain-containing protein [Sphingobacteriales bacterium]
MSFKPVPLDLPPYPFQLTRKDDIVYIFDGLRKKHLVLTPEEWVRQHFIMYLVNAKRFPKALIQVEGGLQLNSLQKRTDIVVFNKEGQKIMIIECKAPSVKITQEVFDQAARYNSIHKTGWIVVTNGLEHYYAVIDQENGRSEFKEELPDYGQL